jgi:hypothetical protein
MYRSSVVACIATEQTGHGLGGLGFDIGWFTPYDCSARQPVNYGYLRSLNRVRNGPAFRVAASKLNLNVAAAVLNGPALLELVDLRQAACSDRHSVSGSAGISIRHFR